MLRLKRIKLASYLLLGLGIMLAPFAATSGASASNPSNNCWVYKGGSTSTGGCVGSSNGGSYFQVHEWCGSLHIQVSSDVTYAPANVAKNATTKGCPFWSSGVTDAVVTSW